MVTAAWDASNLVALYKDGVQCTSCCTIECADCTSKPIAVWISLANFIDCGCFTWWIDDSRSADGEGIADGIKGVYYCVNQDPGGMIMCSSGNCAYQSDSNPEGPGASDFEGDFGTLHSYSNSDDCTGGVTFERNLDRLRIFVCLHNGFAHIHVWVGDSNHPNYPGLLAFDMMFNGVITYVGDEKCADTDERGSNDLAECVQAPEFNGVRGGSVGIWPADPCDTASPWVSMKQYYSGEVALDSSDCYMANVDSQSTTRPGLNSDWVIVL